MIFILKESHMNGTVTMNTWVSGIEAKTFKKAVEKLEKSVERRGIELLDIRREKSSFSYRIATGISGVYGIMEDEPLKMLE